MNDTDCDWCAFGHRGNQPMPDHIGMLFLCRLCIRRFELQHRLRKEQP